MTMAFQVALIPRDRAQLIGHTVLTKGQERLLKMGMLCLLVFLNTEILGVEAYATAFTSVSEVLNTSAFTGNTAWLEKLNFLAKWTQALISIFGIVGIMLNAIQIIITVMALTMPKFWDKVDEVHKAEGDFIRRTVTGGVNAFNSKGSSVIDAAKTKGADLFFEFFYSLMPNIKAMSDVGDGEYKSALDYFIKTGGRYVTTFLIYTMMLSGTLFDSYIVIVDGFGAVANRIGSVDSAAWVNGLLDSKTLYTFSLGRNGNELEQFKGSLARKMYSEFATEASQTEESVRYQVAGAIEQWASKLSPEDIIGKIPGAGESLAAEDWKYVSASITLNNLSDAGSAYKVAASTVGIGNGSDGKPLYYHIFFNYKPKAKDGTFYFNPQD